MTENPKLSFEMEQLQESMFAPSHVKQARDASIRDRRLYCKLSYSRPDNSDFENAGRCITYYIKVFPGLHGTSEINYVYRRLLTSYSPKEIEAASYLLWRITSGEVKGYRKLSVMLYQYLIKNFKRK